MSDTHADYILYNICMNIMCVWVCVRNAHDIIGKQQSAIGIDR